MTIYEELTGTKQRLKLRPLLAPAIWVAAPLAFLCVFWLTKDNKTLMNWLILHITTPIKHMLSASCGLFPFSVAEVTWVLTILAVLAFLLRTGWLLIRRTGRLMRLARRLLAAISALLIIYSGYTLMWGINYYGDSLSDMIGLKDRGATMEELYQLTAAFAQKCSQLSGSVSRDEDGVCNEDVDDIFARSAGIYTGIETEFPVLLGPTQTVKQLSKLSSIVMSYTGFTGVYYPFTAESLLNIDAPVCLLPSTILHELAHQRNVAAEQEANFVAVLAGLRSDDPLYQYSSALLGFIHLNNALYSVDRELWSQARAYLNDDVLSDLAANNAYWDSFEGPVEEASEAVYESFLQSYEQTMGMKSYGACVDLLVAYYFDGAE